MADKVSDFIEKGLVMLNSKKAKYDIQKVKKSLDKTCAQVTVLSYRIFPETTVKIDASEAAVASQHCYPSTSKSIKMTCFLGGALVATVLVTTIIAIFGGVIAPETTSAACYCLYFPGYYRVKFSLTCNKSVLNKNLFRWFELVNLAEDTVNNLPQFKQSEIAENGSINFTSSDEYSKETNLATGLSAISTGQTNRFNKLGANSSIGNNEVIKERVDNYLFETRCTESLMRYNISITDALNLILWTQRNLPTCLAELMPFSKPLNTPSAVLKEESDEESDSDENTLFIASLRHLIE